MTPHERLALDMALMYRSKGFNPLPSCVDAKKPSYRFAPYWETRAPDEWFAEENWATTNVQVMTGRAWRLLVIDLDGAEARDVWSSWGKVPPTWMTHREGGDSWHVWLRLPANHPTALPARFLWKGQGKHQGIERLCDRSLIVAPPSFHAVHRASRYRFLSRACSPLKLPLPAPCPAWVLQRPTIEPVKVQPAFVPPPLRPRDAASDTGTRLDREQVLSAIGDKIAVAKTWGLRFTGHVSADGWAECHALDRPDQDPSAAMHRTTGVYVDRGPSGTVMPYLDVMVAQGRAHDWRDAMERLAERRY